MSNVMCPCESAQLDFNEAVVNNCLGAALGLGLVATR